jgi:hypothetical protein
MIQYFSDSDGLYVIGIYSVNLPHKKIKKYIEDIVCWDLFETEVDIDDSELVGEFIHDTVIIKTNQFDESFLDLAKNGIYLYIME